ncbi:MAG: N-6 DNA methylase [Burkholderiales bacterium]|nr:N-6 DNA methylase [Burkholderiales bacterium]
MDMRITALLIEALGYSKQEYEYNAQAGRQRPDFVIKIDEYPRQACFIVEDKNTAALDLRHHRPQLQGYMTQFGASRGMLVNGHAILVYDQMEGGLHTPAIEIPLAQAVHAWTGGDILASGKSKIDALDACGFIARFSALWRRFQRGSFASLRNLIDDLTLQNETGNNKPHKPNGKTWTNTYCRLRIVPVTHDNADQLTEAIKELISEFEDDADAQLAAVETDFNAYKDASKKIPTENTTLQEQEDNLIQTAMQLMVAADKETKEYDEGLLRKIMHGDVLMGELKQIERRLYALHAIKSGKGTDRDPIYVLISRIRAYTEKRYRYLTKLEAQHKASIKVYHHIETWKEKTASLVFQSDDAKLLRREFLAQTAYLVIIRILLVRIMEDKGLVNRMFTNGGVSLWFRQVESHYLEHAMGRSADFLLELAYTSAQHIYAHFFAERTVLDWYIPDRNAVVRVLHKLAGFDLSNINRDIIGTVYNQYVEAKHKHESGMYFTSPDVVSFMLDRIGYKGTDIIGKKLIDLSCGSGGFLVEAATRLVSAYREYWRGRGHSHVPAEEVQTVLNEIRDCLHGVDLNPFACSLAETNLLIQVIDLFSIAHKGDQPATIERFHIYNSDSLSFSADTLASQAGTLPFPDEDLPKEDQIKAGIGQWRDKFDFVVGNPPYVKANESDAMLSYRDRIKREYPSEAVRSTMVLKWDLFVPFVAASLNLLKQESEHGKAGKMAIITSNAIETVPYCDGLRELFVNRATVDEVHFFPGVKLFEDAMVQNTITVATNRPPTGHTHTERFWHETAPKWGSLSHARSQNLRQSHYKTSVFRQELPTLTLAHNVKAIPLEDIFYISVGMVLNANEKTNKGAFTIDDLIADQMDSAHPAPFAGSKDVDYFGIINVRYLEYGSGTRVPAQVRRPTFPELYDRPKLMVAEFGGFAYDDGTWDDGGFLKCNHSVFLLMRWCHLAGVDNKSIRNQLDHRAPIREMLETDSAKIDPWYVLAFLNSQQMRALLDGVNRSAIAGRLQPDDLRQISIPIPDDPAVMAAIAQLAQRASGIQKMLLPLRKAGWRIDDSMAQAPANIPANIPGLSIDRARVKWGLHISMPSAKVHKLVRSGHRLFSGKQEVAQIAPSEPELAIEWLRRQFQTFPEGTTLGEIEQAKPLIPETPELAEKALALLVKEEQRVAGLLAEIKETRQEISDKLETLFERINHPPIKSGKLAA